ncbi:NADH dehydrogenase [ubiquinone] 1 beta subcomplex subunit 6 [Folsomia candida]|uniref:NADH dehydrogenase [ubiquinone] 1 beta subcomplex subunit 6 n=1 Tax=Folsomia candida TaxID=158441 RepID=A0A226CVU9_FOLCA|nr:NADH dehydrogenase [ubiquinone] 1 beta subcomplex subunit 6 [Folsomia candida]OXA37049.1 NADH dehydrogenase [ubiquinone] 1 beta subcomplex subunit 6 [Folsomia candida]
MAGGQSIDGAGDQAAGVKPMSITGRMVRERERLTGMTPEERAWRKKWLKDQILSPNEPKYIKELHSEAFNPIRRFYRYPLDFVFHRVLQPFIGEVPAKVARFYVGRAALIYVGVLATWYLFKYNNNKWDSKSGWRIIRSKAAILPGEPGYGEVIPDKKPNDYIDRGFKASILNKYKET